MVADWSITPEDSGLLQAVAGRDALGLQQVWSRRGRLLTTALTEQTWWPQGFQLLISTYWLWERFVADRPALVREQRAFYLLTEQAFARSYVYMEGNDHKVWMLPGRSRLAHQGREAVLSIAPEHQLLRYQLANGTWGLYRGAAQRAGLIRRDAELLTDEARAAVDGDPGLTGTARSELFRRLEALLAARKEKDILPLHGMRHLVRDLHAILKKLPQRTLLRDRLLRETPICRDLARRLRSTGEQPRFHRAVLDNMAAEVPEHHDTLLLVLACENLLAPLEEAYLRLGSAAGDTLARARASLKIDLPRLRSHQAAFRAGLPASGGLGVPRDRALAGLERRNERDLAPIDLGDKERFVQSLLDYQDGVAKQRGNVPWLVREGQRLVANTDFGSTPDGAPAVASELTWRNDYYLAPLRSMARALHVVRAGP